MVFEESVRFKLHISWKHQNKADIVPPLGQTGTTGDLMAAQTRTVDWRGRQYRGRHRRLVWPCLSLSLRDRCHQSHRQEEEHVPSDSELYQ